jgi:polyphosphate kinase 2 (PPK2 family)
MLEKLDLDKKLKRSEWRELRPPLQIRLYDLQKAAYDIGLPVIVLFEGWDAAGKGTSISMLTQRLDPRGFKVWPIRAARTYEMSHPWLWRFWLKLPNRGEIAIFDRSWYGRVMVDRIEGSCTELEWKRAYREINQFERQLSDFGTIVFKFWLHISKDEQVRRFNERAATAYKAWKLTDEDWRNREKWDLYEAAVEEMLLKTSTLTTPWTIVEGTDKLWARVKILRTVVDRLCQELDCTPEILTHDLTKARKPKSAAAAVADKETSEEDKTPPKGRPEKKAGREQKAEKGR